MGVAVDCSRSTVYLSEAEGLRATGLDGTTKWYQPLSGGWGVALDGSTGNVYVAQYLARTVLALTPGGSLVRTIGSSLKGASGRLVIAAMSCKYAVALTSTFRRDVLRGSTEQRGFMADGT